MQQFEGKFTINGYSFKEGFLSYKEVLQFPLWRSEYMSAFVPLMPVIQYYEVLIKTRGEQNAAEIWRDAEWLIQYKHPSGLMENWKVHRDNSEIDMLDMEFHGEGRMFEPPTLGESRINRIRKIKRLRQIAGYLWRDNGKTILRTTGPCL